LREKRNKKGAGYAGPFFVPWTIFRLEDYRIVPEPETLPEPEALPDPETLPEAPPESDPDKLPEVEPEALPDVLPEPESTLPVAAPPRGPLSFTCALHPANANAPTSSGTASIVVFIVFTSL
jgi:hypothetical protein